MNFTIPPLVTVLFNTDQMLFVVDDITSDPLWKKLTFSFGSDKQTIDIKVNNSVVAILTDTGLSQELTNERFYFLGWSENSTIKSRPVNVDLSQLSDQE